MENSNEYIENLVKKAVDAKRSIRGLSTQIKNNILGQLSNELIYQKDKIIKANLIDLEDGRKKNLPSALLERLNLDENRIGSLANSVMEIVSLPDPIGDVLKGNTLPNGLELVTKRVPLGVIFVIYESRPNVTIDVGALSFKSGNVCILRGGSEAFHTNKILVDIFSSVLEKNGISKNAVLFIEHTDRSVLLPLLKKSKEIDIVVPRGGAGLIQFVTENSTIPVVKHDKGVCNLFIDESALLEKSISIVINSKVQRPGVCNALENLIIHKNFPFTKEILQKLLESGVELYLDETLQKDFPNCKLATEEDFKTEFLDLKLSVKCVDDINGAIDFIETYSSGHTEAILSENYENIQYFLRSIDSAAIFVNTSTRFHDGGEFGFGAEVGISTGKLHVRGPMGLEHLTTTTTYLYGNGQIRN